MVLVTTIATLAILFGLRNPLPGHGQPALMLKGGVVRGGLIAIQGSNFTSGGTISITVDGRPATIASNSSSNQASSDTPELATFALGAYQAATTPSTGGTVPVRSDGTFDIRIKIDPSWPAGSKHLIVATEQSSGRTAQLTFTVSPGATPTPTQPPPTPTPTPTQPPTPTPTQPPTPTPTPPPSCNLTSSSSSLDFGSVQQGQTASQALTPSNTGGQPLNWSVDTGGAGWLTLDNTSGTLQPGGQQTINVTADTSQLQAGNYSTTLTFSSSCGSPQVAVTLVVTPPPQPPVLQLNTNSLTFNLCDHPKSQYITVTNGGGGTLTWSPSTPSQSWLTVSSASGNVPGTLTLQADPTGLGNGTYTATVDITGSDGTTQTVTVTLSVQHVRAFPNS